MPASAAFLSGQAPRVRPPTHRKKEETQMDRQYDFAALEALLKKRSFKALREALLELNEVDIAEFWTR